jgi:hypothetical protein
MSPKKTILRAVRGASERDPGAPHVRPPTIPGYGTRPHRYQAAVNELLQARLLEGHKDADGHLTIALNEARRREVERLLRPLWARPVAWALLALLVAVGAGLAAA